MNKNILQTNKKQNLSSAIKPKGKNLCGKHINFILKSHSTVAQPALIIKKKLIITKYLNLQEIH
jgi:hypothetical protein